MTSENVQAAQLIAEGPQDIWLTGDPQASFFRSMYRRHVSYGMSVEKFNLNGDTVRFDRRGDLLGACYLTASDPVTNVQLSTFPISALTRVDLFIGGQLVDSQDTTFSSQVWPVTEATTWSERNVPSSFYPLHFFFCKDWSRAFPLVALEYHDLEIKIRDASTSYTLTLWAHMIHLSEPERAWYKRQPHRFLITQTQTARIDLQRDWGRFGGPIKYLAWPNMPLYEFSTFTFTSVNTTGPIGPSLTNFSANTIYTTSSFWPNYFSLYNNTSGYQLWTVPRTGIYTITAAGANGTLGLIGTTGLRGGYGSVITKKFLLSRGETIIIIVGQKAGNPSTAGGGGGATYVIRSNSLQYPLICAAGGGGSGGKSIFSENPVESGNDASTSPVIVSSGISSCLTSGQYQNSAGYTASNPFLNGASSTFTTSFTIGTRPNYGCQGTAPAPGGFGGGGGGGGAGSGIGGSGGGYSGNSSIGFNNSGGRVGSNFVSSLDYSGPFDNTSEYGYVIINFF